MAAAIIASSMKVIGVLVLVLLAVLAVAGIMGAVLPQSHTVSRTVQLAASPEQVYGVISDVSSEPKWRPSIQSVTIGQSADGKMMWTEHMSHGTFPLELVEGNAPMHRVVRIADPKLPFQGDWVYDLAPKGSGTELVITENGVVRNPYFRFANRYIFGYSRTLDDYIADLQRELSQPQQ